MVVLVNGAFGVGKTTVARALRRRMPRAVLFDPEWIGFALRRLPGYRLSDYQHLAAWRRLTAAGARALDVVFPTVIVPMAFSEPVYLEELRSRLAVSGSRVVHFCLTAPIEVVRERLAARGEPREDARWAWVHRRAVECCRAHAGPEFAPQIETTGRTPDAIAGELARRIRETG